MENRSKVELICKVNELLEDKNSLNIQKEELVAGLIVANDKISLQKDEKKKRAIELNFANKEKEKRASELNIANLELNFQSEEKVKRAAEFVIAHIELVHQSEEKEKRAAELVIANKELLYQNKEKEKRAAELIIANKELLYQNNEKERRAAELIIANKELLYQNDEKEKRAAELIIANKELFFQNKEKEKRAAELIIANKELLFQNDEKEKRAAELIIANKELIFQKEEKVKRAAELIVAKDKAELYLDIAGSAFVSLDKNGTIILVNQKFSEIMEYDKSEELMGKNWFETCISYQMKEKTKKIYSDVMKGEIKELHHRESEIVTKSGKRRLIYWNSTLIKDQDGEVIEILASGIDITERHKSEQELIKSKNEFRLLAESMPQIVWVILADGTNIYFNQQWVNYTGLTLEESYGDGWLTPFHPDERTLTLDAWDNAVANNAEYSLECRLRRKDGKYLWWLVRAVPILDKNGIVSKWFGTCTDIQHIKETEVKLMKAKERAEESDQLKSAFLANMSHEIRTPMNGILGFADLLKEPGLTGEMQQEYISIIEKSGARMLNIINDIVDISKIEAGLMEVDIQEANINQQIDFIGTFFKPQAEEKELQIIINKPLSDEESIIKSDTEKIYSVLTNLVKNAIKFSEKGIIELGYTLKTDNEGPELEFYVKDMGIGIPKDRQKHVFKRFIQANISNKMARQGTGLGLAISKAYVKMLKGKLWVESKEGIGSTFYFTLPYNHESPKKILLENDIINLNLIKEDTAKVSNLKILVVEDDAISAMIITRIVKANSKVLLKAQTGYEAVTICRDNPDINLILMDMQMPGLNGFEATKQIREFNKEVVIIAQTAFTLAGDKERTIEAGCNDYISKPINKAALLSLLHKYFDK
ncbi:PAS domain S-box protein [Flavobacterium sp.]